jgi:PAS domain S-box-containing protein
MVALQDTEEQYRQLVEVAPVAIIIRCQGQVAFANSRAADLFGAASPSDLVGVAILDLVHPDFRDSVVRRMRSLDTTGQPQPIQAQTLVRRDGSLVEVELAAISIDYHGRPAALVVAQDITERKRAEAERQRYTERLQALSRQLMAAQETERRRIAGELHDEIGQALTALELNLRALQAQAGSPPDPAVLEESLGILEQTLQQVRDLALDLRPSMLDDLGLVPALRWYADRLAQRTGLVIEFVANRARTPLSAESKTTCFRVAQEALTNVVRHAHARKVVVELRSGPKDVLLIVRDDGNGFDVEAARRAGLAGNSLGLLSMQERVALLGGHLEIRSALSRGSEVRARWPVFADLGNDVKGA